MLSRCYPKDDPERGDTPQTTFHTRTDRGVSYDYSPRSLTRRTTSRKGPNCMTCRLGSILSTSHDMPRRHLTSRTTSLDPPPRRWSSRSTRQPDSNDIPYRHCTKDDPAHPTAQRAMIHFPLSCQTTDLTRTRLPKPHDRPDPRNPHDLPPRTATSRSERRSPPHRSCPNHTTSQPSVWRPDTNDSPCPP